MKRIFTHRRTVSAASCPTGASHALRGSPAAPSLKVADEIDADLIVVGNKGMTGVRRVLGRMASAVTNQSPCNVLVVKTT